MAWKTMVTELLWFLRGDTNIKYLVENGCHIWDGDAYKRFLGEASSIKKGYESGDILGSQPHIEEMFSNPDKLIILTQEEFIAKIKTDDKFAKEWGNLGSIYGKQWRSWENEVVKYSGMKYEGEPIDQISSLINELKTNPDSRRLMVNAWNVGELDQMVLPPCHYGFQLYTRELSNKERYKIWFNNNYETGMEYNENIIPDYENSYYTPTPSRAISLMWNQRSVDTFLGLPFNIASYGLLLEIIAKIVNMVPDELIGNLGDTHLYVNHIEQSKEQIGRPLTFEERYKLYTGSEKTWEEGGGNAFGKITALNMMDDAGVPIRTREPFPLPKLVMPKTDAFWSGFDVSLFGHLDPTDFTIKNYNSHPSIKAPLSN
jgi:thymidylate synthase